MATGDAAVAAGMDILSGNELANTMDTEENKTRDYIAGFAAGVRTVAAGGTGADTAAGARENLGVPGWADVAPKGQANAGGIARYSDAGRLQAVSPVAAADVANRQFALSAAADAASSKIGTTGGTITGALFMPNLSAVASSYVAMYRNGDGRVGISPSARRFKKEIHSHPYSLEQLRAIRVVDYRLRAEIYGDAYAPVDVGVIADELVEADLGEFVVYDENGEPLSVHYERLALVAIGALQELARTVDALAERLDALEAGA